MRALGILLGFVALAPLAACDVSSSSFSCQNADCRISLAGGGAEAEVDALDTTFRLVSVEDDVATLEADGQELTLREGESAQAAGLEVKCEQIDGGEVELTTSAG